MPAICYSIKRRSIYCCVTGESVGVNPLARFYTLIYIITDKATLVYWK